MLPQRDFGDEPIRRKQCYIRMLRREFESI